MPGVGQFFHKVAVIGEQDQAFTVFVQTPCRKEACAIGQLDQVHRLLCRMVIAVRTDIAPGLVQHDVMTLGGLARDDFLSITNNRVGRGYARSRIRFHNSVYQHVTFLDQLGGMTARSDPGGAEIFCQIETSLFHQEPFLIGKL